MWNHFDKSPTGKKPVCYQTVMYASRQIKPPRFPNLKAIQNVKLNLYRCEMSVQEKVSCGTVFAISR